MIQWDGDWLSLARLKGTGFSYVLQWIHFLDRAWYIHDEVHFKKLSFDQFVQLILMINFNILREKQSNMLEHNIRGTDIF